MTRRRSSGKEPSPRRATPAQPSAEPPAAADKPSPPLAGAHPSSDSSSARRRTRTLSLPTMLAVAEPGPPRVKVVHFPKKKRVVPPRQRESPLDGDHSPKVRKSLTHILTGAGLPRSWLDDEGRAELGEVGHQLYECGQLAEARQVFEALVALEPTEAFPYTMLGAVFLAQGDADRALALFSAALQHDPDDVASLVYRGEIRLARRLFRRGAQDLRRALQLDGDPASPFAHRARAALALSESRRSLDGGE